MKKLLVICGPTATGKTRLGISLAKKFNGELISADSRQVYKGMDIGTGKDIPKSARLHKGLFSKYGYYEIDGVRIWGYDLTDPRRDFSVGQYLKIVRGFIKDISKRGRLPVLVGGSGLYIKGVVDGIPTAEIPQNKSLRKNLEKRTTEELYENLSEIDSLKAASLNSSDRKNPRRLIRAIEIAQWELLHKGSRGKSHSEFNLSNNLFIGIRAPLDFLSSKIEQRVKERLLNGIRDEVRKLLKMGVKWEDQSMMSLGYGVWRDNFEGGVDEKTILDEWKIQEIKYAKRQMTWFKKDKRIKWFDITNGSYPKNVEKLAEKWYKSSYAKES